MARLSWLPLALCAAACTEQEFNIQNNPPPAGDLVLSGRVCHPVFQTWLPNALVYTHLYDDNDVVYDSRSDYTDEAGFYELTDLVANKDYEVYVQVGQDIVDKFIVNLGSEDLQVPPPACFDEAGLEVAVITGAYDSLAPVLDAIGVTGVTVIDGQVGSEITDFLTDPASLGQYDMVFFDGGHREDGVIYGNGPIQAVHDNLRAYVQGGGVVFASDWAYDVVEQIWPSKIDFYGDDAVPDAAQVGELGVVTADIVDSALSGQLGVPVVDVAYDLPVWPLIESVDPSVTVYLSGDAPYRVGFDVFSSPDVPLLAGFDDGSGRVVFTTYRNSSNNNQAMLGVLLALVDAL